MLSYIVVHNIPVTSTEFWQVANNKKITITQVYYRYLHHRIYNVPYLIYLHTYFHLITLHTSYIP